MPTAVMVHGAGGGGWEWRLWAGVFVAEGWNVLAPDLGPTGSGLAETSLEDYADQVTAWCKNAPRPYCLIGASLGGLLALMVAGKQPPNALVLVNPLPLDGIASVPGLPERPAIVPWSRSAFEQTRRALPDAGMAAVRWVHPRWRDESGLALNQARAGLGREFVPACSTLVLSSELDKDVPIEASRRLADGLGAEYACMPDCSHLGILLGRMAPLAAVRAHAWCTMRLQGANAS